MSCEEKIFIGTAGRGRGIHYMIKLSEYDIRPQCNAFGMRRVHGRIFDHLTEKDLTCETCKKAYARDKPEEYEETFGEIPITWLDKKTLKLILKILDYSGSLSTLSKDELVAKVETMKQDPRYNEARNKTVKA